MTDEVHDGAPQRRSLFARIAERVCNRRALAPAEAALTDRPVDRIEAYWLEDPELSDRGREPASDPRQYRPLRAGCGISRISTRGPGTLGCFVRERSDADAVLLLSNYHVLFQPPGGSPFATSDAIVQPANATRGSGDDPEPFTVANGTGGLYADGVDAAVARLVDGMAWENRTPRGATIQGIDRARLGDAVWKHGAGSQWTRGIVTAVGITVDLTNRFGAGTLAFPDQIEVTTIDKREIAYFQYQGDSGAVLCNDRNRIVGLLHSGSPHKALATPIRTVFERLNLELA